MSEIMDVPFPRAASRLLISFLTFQISMFFSASLACGSLMMGYERRGTSGRAKDVRDGLGTA